jgi:hypothetical protein
VRERVCVRVIAARAATRPDRPSATENILQFGDIEPPVTDRRGCRLTTYCCKSKFERIRLIIAISLRSQKTLWKTAMATAMTSEAAEARMAFFRVGCTWTPNIFGCSDTALSSR